jgi:hypothetical protein
MPEIVLRYRARPARYRAPLRIGARADERAQLPADDGRDLVVGRRGRSGLRMPPTKVVNKTWSRRRAVLEHAAREERAQDLALFLARNEKAEAGERVGDVRAAIERGHARDSAYSIAASPLLRRGRERANERRRLAQRAPRRSTARARRTIARPRACAVDVHVPSASRSTRSTRTPPSPRARRCARAHR